MNYAKFGSYSDFRIHLYQFKLIEDVGNRHDKAHWLLSSDQGYAQRLQEIGDNDMVSQRRRGSADFIHTPLSMKPRTLT
jgi:hypothetical protein